MPTIYEAIGIKPPEHVEGTAQIPIDGVSMMYTWNNASAAGRKDTQYFEVMGSRGVYKDGWFASVFGPRIPWAAVNETRMREWNPDTDIWELYDLTKDYSQAHDLAKEHPEQVNKMKDIFLVEAQKNKVLPVGAGLWTIYYHPEEGPRSPLTEWYLYEGMTRIAESNAPLFHTGFSSVATVDIEVPKNASGSCTASAAPPEGSPCTWIRDISTQSTCQLCCTATSQSPLRHCRRGTQRLRSSCSSNRNQGLHQHS